MYTVLYAVKITLVSLKDYQSLLIYQLFWPDSNCYFHQLNNICLYSVEYSVQWSVQYIFQYSEDYSVRYYLQVADWRMFLSFKSRTVRYLDALAESILQCSILYNVHNIVKGQVYSNGVPLSFQYSVVIWNVQTLVGL